MKTRAANTFEHNRYQVMAKETWERLDAIECDEKLTPMERCANRKAVQREMDDFMYHHNLTVKKVGGRVCLRVIIG